MSYSSQSLRSALQNQIRRLQQKVVQLEKQSQRLSMVRLGTFIGGLFLIYLAGSYGPEWLFWLSMPVFIGCFYKLIGEHKHLDQSVEKFKIWRSIRNRHLARQSLDWKQLPYRPPSIAYPDHPFASDLNIIGQHSLLQLCDTGNYQGSTDQLAELLLIENPGTDAVARRQAIIQELAALPSFRDRLHLRATLHQKKQLETDWTLEELREHLDQSKAVDYSRPLFILGTLATLNILLTVLYVVGLIPPYLIFSLVLYLIVYNFNSGKSEGLYEESSQLEKQLSRFNAVLHYLESFPYRPKSKLKEFCSIYWNQKHSPSEYLQKIIRIAGAASSQQSDVIWMLLNLIVPWDLYFTQKLSSYKKELAPRLSQWVDHFYKLEALSSLANFSWLNPTYTFTLPDVKAEPPFYAEELGHPLIPKDEKVNNDLTITSKGELLLITGSNMAGKSTFLRTIGINLALCFSGG
ncbi:MAG TPA: hypothetical protein VK074_07345, partial [Fodinibius sp.]|nr:hypothetical protein [Fodinibius sp.]